MVGTGGLFYMDRNLEEEMKMRRRSERRFTAPRIMRSMNEDNVANALLEWLYCNATRDAMPPSPSGMEGRACKLVCRQACDKPMACDAFEGSNDVHS